MTLYIYDHCPYCVKARMLFGYKNIDVKLITLLNDDEETPIKLIGQKMVPILSIDENTHLPESLDIISYINSKYDSNIFLDEEQKLDETLSTWLTESRSYVYLLAMPRWIRVDLEEFKTESSIKYFTQKKETYIGPFSEHMKNSKDLISDANNHLLKLEDLLTEESDFYSNKPSFNDIHLFPTLRSLSVTKGISFPKKVLSYMRTQEHLTRVPLHLDKSL